MSQILQKFAETEHHFIVEINTGQIVCINCGLVKEINIIAPKLSIPRNFQDKNSYSYNNYKKKGKINQNLNRALKMDKYHSWDIMKIEKGTREIKRLSGKYNVGKGIKKNAINLFKRAIKLKKFAFKYINLIAQVSFFYTMRNNKFPIEIGEVIEDYNFKISLANKFYYTLMKELKLRRPSILAINIISKICSSLNLSETIEKTARKAYNLFIQERNTSGLNNFGIAAGIVYFSCCVEYINISQKTISEVANVSEITIHNRFKEIRRICSKYEF